jgi:hypothetical protein
MEAKIRQLEPHRRMAEVDPALEMTTLLALGSLDSSSLSSASRSPDRGVEVDLTKSN